MKYFFKGHIYVFLFFYPAFLKAQDIESIGKKQQVKVSGSLGFNNTFYQATGINNRRPPYLWYLTGNVNISLYGWSVPLSVYYSNQNVQFRQPFNHTQLILQLQTPTLQLLR